MSQFNRSSHLMFFYYSIKTFYAELSGDWKSLKVNAEKFLEIVKTNSRLNCDPYLGIAYIDLSNANLMLANYKKAIENASPSLKYFRKGSLNELESLEIIFLASIPLENLPQASKALTRAYRNPNSKPSSDDPGNAYEYERWQVYHAYFLYKQGEYTRLGRKIKRVKKLVYNSIYWYFSVMLLEIYADLAMGLSPREKIAALERQYQREGSEMPRFKLIIKVLNKLDSTGFNFQQAAEKAREELELLASREGSYAFNPWDGEVIPFHHWFREQCGENVLESRNESH